MAEIAADAVDVWFMNLDVVAASRGSELGALLSDDERNRARGFSVPTIQRRFAAGREMIRLLLGKQSGLDPSAVVFEYGQHGKPFLSGRRRVYFSVAHCDELCVVAVTERGRVGVDVERLRDGLDVDRIARQVFSAEEAERLSRLPAPERARAFFHRWVREEALVKANGTGLLSSLASRSGPRKKDWVRPPASRIDVHSAWTFCAFSPAADVVGCVALLGSDPVELRHRSFAELEALVSC